MKLSELIKEAASLLAEHGDIPVGMLTDEGLYCGHATAIYFEHDEGEDDGEPLVLIQP